MRFYCGIDLHAKDSYLCVIDRKEKIHLRKKVPNQLPIILHELDQFSPKPSVVLESTLNWYWIVDGSQEAGFNVKLAHIFGLRMITGAKVKTDRRDAFGLAKLLRLDAVPEAYIYPKEKRPARDLLRRRNRLVMLRAGEYGSLRRLLLKHGILEHTRYSIKRITEEDIELWFKDPAIQVHVRQLLRRIWLYTDQIKPLDKTILKADGKRSE